jgi:hypothetical protein
MGVTPDNLCAKRTPDRLLIRGVKDPAVRAPIRGE